MKVDDLLRTASDAVSVRKVYGEPFEKDGVTIITAASVAGGGGGGSGVSPGPAGDGGGAGAEARPLGEGEGGGLGLAARPAGAYLLRDGELTWRPAVDVNRLVTTAGVVAVVYLLARMRVQVARSKAAARPAGE